MSAMDSLTDVQIAAVNATAEQTLRDPEDLAVELFPLIYIKPNYEKDPPP